MAISITACSKAKMESRLELVFVSSVMDVLREEMVGLVKTREAAPEASDIAFEFPSPVGDRANPSIVFRCRSEGIRESFEPSPGSSPSSAVEPRVFGLMCGEAMIPS